MNRAAMLQKIKETDIWDFVIIGGGATGLGTALEAVTRGYKTLLLEKYDFAKGTSSRSTKMVHGGVRYLAQGNINLVREALQERGLLRKNAPHLVKNQAFLIPAYRWYEKWFYGIGMKVYDALAGKLGLLPSQIVSRPTALSKLPLLKAQGLNGGVVYYDGQFDDARLAVNLAETIAEQGGTILNYFPVVNLSKNPHQRLNGLLAQDSESGQEYPIKARMIVNATGVFADQVLAMDNPQAPRMLKPSQGIHLVLDKSFLNSDTALMIPRTSDGRVLFVVPWHDKLVVGTTDTPVETADLEPQAHESEIDFILKTAGNYLNRPPQRSDVLSVYVGLRPLVATNTHKTKDISRNHKIITSPSDLITIIGGKWTTFRKMGEDLIDFAERHFKLAPTQSRTQDLLIHGADLVMFTSSELSYYGSDIEEIQALVQQNPAWGNNLHPNLPLNTAQVVWAVREEMAREIEDVLARRTRCLLLDARASLVVASEVAKIMAQELGYDLSWQALQIEKFKDIAQKYILV
ncbi:MAG: glycerol-3-phosphate dehydrogenase/oxidase [Microscillaceae bacterium]|jgi:glycerol-3-phosphate dehydrogenase|nr:glycerol-3-phosphate dehydrogenase/oxidase [Microscillaceae bacterium]